ncbi:MAG: hypothetical protein WAW88_01085 [Nocardioides sp.]
MPQNPLEPEYSLPDRLKTRTLEEERLAAAHEQAVDRGDPVPPWGMAYDGARLGRRRQ